MPALLLSACAPSASGPTASLGAVVRPAAEAFPVQSSATLPFLIDVVSNALMDTLPNLRVADNWNTFKRVEYNGVNIAAWEATSKDGLSKVRTSVKLMPLAQSGYTKVEITTTGLPDDAGKAFNGLVLDQVKRRL